MNFHVQASFVNLEKSSFDPFLLFNLNYRNIGLDALGLYVEH